MKRWKSIIVCFVLFAMCLTSCASAPSGTDSETQMTSSGYTPTLGTNGNGDNRIGNFTENQQNGGFIATQGELLFYADFLQDGRLCMVSPYLSEPKYLTDFPVAGLSLSGDTLVFTDISQSYVYKDEKMYPVQASYGELLMQTEDPAKLFLGGNLYKISGVRNGGDGGEWTVAPIAPGRSFTRPVLVDGALIAIETTQTDSFSLLSSDEPGQVVLLGAADVPTKSEMFRLVTIPQISSSNGGNIAEIGITSPEYPRVLAMITFPDACYVELASDDGIDSHKIVRLDTRTMQPVEELTGYNMREAWGYLIFKNPADRLLYAITPETAELVAISSVICPDDFLIDENGNVSFTAQDSMNISVHIVISRNNPLPLGDGITVVPVVSMNDWFTYVNPYAPFRAVVRNRLQDRPAYVMKPQDPPTPPKRPEIYCPEDPEGPGGCGGLPPITGDGIRGMGSIGDIIICGPMDPPTITPPVEPTTTVVYEEKYPSPTDAARAALLMFQGKRYDDPDLQSIYTQKQFDAVYDYYDGETLEGYVEELAEMFMSSAASIPGSEAEKQRLSEKYVNAIFDWLDMADYEIQNEEIDADGQNATVELHSYSRVDVALFMDALKPYMLKCIANYPGGQNALRDQGEDFAAIWMLEKVLDAMLEPESLDFMSDTLMITPMTLRFEEGFGWVVYDSELILEALLGMGT